MYPRLNFGSAGVIRDTKRDDMVFGSQMTLPEIPVKERKKFQDVKPGEYFRRGLEGFIFYCSNGKEEWQGKVVYRVYSNRNIMISPRKGDIPPDDEEVDVIDSSNVKAA